MPHKNYDAVTKANALKELDNGKTMTDVAKAIGAAPNTIAYWKKQADKAAKKAPKAKSKRRKVGAKRATGTKWVGKSAPQKDELDYVMEALEAVKKLNKTGREIIANWLERNPE